MELPTGAMTRFAALACFLTAILCQQSVVAQTVFFDDDFEDGSLGSATTLSIAPNNIGSDFLDGRSLRLHSFGQSVAWDLRSTDSTTYYVRFDIHATPDSTLTFFLDEPRIVRSDLRLVGTHQIEAFYDVSAQTASVWVDGVVDSSALTFAAWSNRSVPTRIRFTNQFGPPGNSDGSYEIDNVFIASMVPEPGHSKLVPLMLLIAWMRTRSHRMTKLHEKRRYATQCK